MLRFALSLLLLFSLTSSLAQSVEHILRKADSLVFASELDRARQTLNEFLSHVSDQKNKAILLNKQSEILIAQGKIAEAEKILSDLISVNWTDKDKASYLTNLGFLNLHKGRYDLALEELQKAHDLFQQDGLRNTKEAAKCLSYLSLSYSSSGKYNQAQENGLIAMQLREQLFGENSEEVAASYNDLGLVYSQTDPDKALEYYEMALPIYQKLHGNDHPKIAIASTNIGVLYQALELYGDAVNNLETALKIWKKIYPNGHPNEAFVQRSLGQTYVKMGNHKAALGYFEQALTLYQKSYGAKHPDISSTLNQIGVLYLDDQKFDEALAVAQKAICANIPSFNNEDILVNPPISEYYNGNVLLYSLGLKAQAYETRYLNKTLKMSDLKQALSCLALCDSLIDDIRHHSTDESDKISLGAIASEVYEDGVRVATSMSEITLNPKPYRETAFYFAEKSKSAVLQESIADAQAKSFAGIPESLVEEEKTLKSTIAFLSQKLSQKPTEDEEKYLRESLFNLNNEYNSFIKKLEKDYPNYFNLKFNSFSPTVGDLQQRLNNRQAIVSFFMAEEGSRIYHFIITKKKFDIYSLSLPANFDRFLKGLNNGIYYRDYETYSRSTAPIKKLLTPHVPASVNELIIIPSGRLGTIPFEALPYKSKGDDFETTNYLAGRFAISYEFSVGLIAQKNKTTEASFAPSIFLCAPVEFPEKDNLNELPGTEAEVNTIASLFTSSAKQMITHSEANESRVKSNDLSKYSILHFATHGVVDETEPELSRIFLNTDDNEDGNLFAGEIYNLNLNADLAVLSACQTGLGKFSKGEGVIGLSRALVYAGAKNLIVSFWSVADESTAKLMTDFYDILLKQKRPNYRVALQTAKTKMIKEKGWSSPYFWAPFVLIGF